MYLKDEEEMYVHVKGNLIMLWQAQGQIFG